MSSRGLYGFTTARCSPNRFDERGPLSANSLVGNIIVAQEDKHLVLGALTAGDRAGVAPAIAGPRRAVARRVIVGPGARGADEPSDAGDGFAVPWHPWHLDALGHSGVTGDALGVRRPSTVPV